MKSRKDHDTVEIPFGYVKQAVHHGFVSNYPKNVVTMETIIVPYLKK
jgi:hypothetical protein